MPGIVGLITKMPRYLAERQLVRMLETLAHESFYEQSIWIDESSGVYVGAVARKGSFAGAMPLRNETGDIILFFAGEEFPDPRTVQRLREQGHEFDADGASYLVHLYEEDRSFPAVLNGRFHGILIDVNRETTVLFNDRYGMNKICCHESSDGFFFAPEAKAILAVRPELRRLNPQAAGEFLSCGSALENRTLFEGISVLPAASAWRFRNGVIEEKKSYFHPKEWEEQEVLEPEAYYSELRNVFARNLRRYFNGAQRIGMSLTGGLDTRMIMAWQNSRPESLPCYTFGGMFRDCQDVVVARQVAHACSLPHQVIQVGEEFLTRFAYYAERAVYLTEGSVDVGRTPDLYLNERARQIAPVRMTGNYGGEVLRQVRAFKPGDLLPGLVPPEFFNYVRQAEETYAGLVSGHPVSFAVFKQGPWHHAGVLALEETQLSMRSPYLDNDFVRTVFRSPKSALTSNEISSRLIAEGNNRLLQIPTDRGVLGKGGLASVASRSLLEFLFKAEYAYDMGMPQSVARLDKTLSAIHVERLFLGRHKIFHFRLWYKAALSKYVRDVLLDPLSLSRPYIERKQLEFLTRRHLSGDRNYTTEIHKLLTLELLHRRFLDGRAESEAGQSRTNQCEVSLQS